MSTAIWPPLPADQIDAAVAETQDRELEWLLAALQETLQSFKAGLEDCAALLAPRDIGSTLVLSSQRSESIKGFITLNGARLTKGDVQLRLPTLPPPRGQNSFRISVSAAPTAPTVVVAQLVEARTLINSCLDVVDATAWTGDAKSAEYISSQLRLLQDNVQEARLALKGGQVNAKTWHGDPIDKNCFEPALPPILSLQFVVVDAALVLVLRTLEILPEGSSTGASTPNSTVSQTYSGFSIRDRLAQAFGAPPVHKHDESDELFTYKGQHVRVKDKLRVETQDPSLMAALAKLSALEHTVALSRRALDVVMGREQTEDGDD